MSAIQGTITKFLSLADGTLRLQVDVHHRDSTEALALLCEVGATVAVARLVEEQTEQRRYDSVTVTGSGRQVDEEPDPIFVPSDILDDIDTRPGQASKPGLPPCRSLARRRP